MQGVYWIRNPSIDIPTPSCHTDIYAALTSPLRPSERDTRLVVVPVALFEEMWITLEVEGVD